MHSLLTIAVVSLHSHDLLSDGDTLLDSAETEDAAQARVGLLVTVSYAHTATGRDVEASKVTVLVDDGDEADVVGEDVDIVCRRNSDRDFELPTHVSDVRLENYGGTTHLPRQVELAVQRLDILQCLTSNKLLVQPDLVVCGRAWKQMLADAPCEVVSLSVQLRQGRDGRDDDVPAHEVSREVKGV